MQYKHQNYTYHQRKKGKEHLIAVTKIPQKVLSGLYEIKYKNLFEGLNYYTLPMAQGCESSLTGQYLEKYIQQLIVKDMKNVDQKNKENLSIQVDKLRGELRQHNINPSNINLREIQLPKVPDIDVVTNKEINYQLLVGEYDIIYKQTDGQTVIMDIKCVSSNCEKYCWQQQAIYSYMYYKKTGIIPISKLYFVYQQQIVQFQLDYTDIKVIEKILAQYIIDKNKKNAAKMYHPLIKRPNVKNTQQPQRQKIEE